MAFSCNEYTVNSFQSLKCYGLSLLHCNICSLHKNFHKLVELLSDVNYSFDFICLSETFLYTNQHSFFPLPHYTFVGDSRNTRAGGAGIYVRSGMAVSGVLPVSLTGAEAVSLRLAVTGDAPLCLTVVYRAPSSDIGMFLQDLDLFLSSREVRHLNHIITGDLNINTLKPESSDYLDIIHQYNFTNLITIPTRVTATSQTCIDHILVNFLPNDITSGTITKDTSDHFPVFVFLDSVGKADTTKFHRRCKNII